MTVTLAELRQSFHGPGRLERIGLRPARKRALVLVERADIEEAGLAGDHGRAGERAVTLIQAEHLPVIAALCGLAELAPERLRRNLVVSGLNLSALRGGQLRIGEALLEVTRPCAPCSRMEKELGPGGYNAMRGHGGWCARVLESGRIASGDPVIPVPAIPEVTEIPTA